MSKFSKVGLVLGGYAASFLAAAAASFALAWIRRSPDASGGMQAFGDLLGFVGLFGVLALVPTALALYYLRPVEGFWKLLSLASLALAAAGVVAAVVIGMTHVPQRVPLVGFISTLTVLGSPLLGFALLVCAAITRFPRSRWLILASAGIEFTVGAYAFVSLFVVGHWIH